jgi:plastocyanin
MRRSPTRHLTVAAASAVALLGLLGLTGCGDTDSSDDAGGAACGADAGTTVTVKIPEFEFSPQPVEIESCDSVVWENAHDQAHTSTGKGDQSWSTGNIAPGSTSEPVRFESPGSFAYICALHPFMEGTVEVS